MSGQTGRPSFGVELHQYLDAATLLAEVQLAEGLGYDSVWLGDSQLIWRELYVLLGAAAATTSRIKLGTGVTNPVTRHAAVTASALVTLQELSGQRVLAGIGVGDSAVKTIGEQVATRATLARYVETVRTLAEGGVARTAEADLRLTFGGPGRCPPIVVAASGPKMLRLAGEIGDGVIVTRQARAGERLRAMLECVQDGRTAARRADLPFMTCLSASVAIHPDRQPAMQAVRPHVASTLRLTHWGLSERARAASEALATTYNYYEHMSPSARHAELIPDDVVTEFAIAGTREECIRQAVALFEAGIDEMTIRPYGVNGGSRAATIETFAREVMDPLRSKLGR